MITDDLFDICKRIEKTELSNELREIEKSLSKPKDFSAGAKSIYFQSKSRGGHFYEILLRSKMVSEGKDDVLFSKTPPLTEHEINKLSEGHEVMNNLFIAVLAELHELPLVVRNSLNPYLKFNELKIEKQIDNSNVDFGKLAKSVSQLSISKELKLNCQKFSLKQKNQLTKLKPRDIYSILMRLEQDIRNKDGETKRQILESMNKPIGRLNDANLLLRLLFDTLRLHTVITICMDTIFSAFMGYSLIVINEDSIINVRKDDSGPFYHDREFILSPNHEIMKSISHFNGIVLMDYNVSDRKIHDFGILDNYSYAFDSEHGSKIDCSLKVLNNELSPYIIH